MRWLVLGATALGILWAAPAAARQSSWMKRLPDQMRLSRLLVPGTHDSAAYQGVGVDRESSRERDSAAPLANPEHYETQAWSIQRQLRLGIRYLDVRISGCGRNEAESYRGRNARCFPTCHGIMVFKDNLADHVLSPVISFLRRHPSEVVFLSLQSAFGSGDRCNNSDNNDCDDRNFPISRDKGKAGLNRLVLKNRRYKRYFAKRPRGKTWGAATLGDVRGRIVLVDNLGWLAGDQAINKPRGKRSQNTYEVDHDSRRKKSAKKRKIRALFERAREAREGNFYINYLSAVDVDGLPSDIDNLAVMGNQTARRWLQTRYLSENFGCWVLMDSVDHARSSAEALIRDLIQRNWDAGKRMHKDLALAATNNRRREEAAAKAAKAAKARELQARKLEAEAAAREQAARRPSRAEVKLDGVTGRCRQPMVQQMLEFGLNAGGKQCELPETKGSARVSWTLPGAGRISHDGKGRRNGAFAQFTACLGGKGVQLLNRMRRSVGPCSVSVRVRFR